MIDAILRKIKTTLGNERGYWGVGLVVLIIFTLSVALATVDRTGGIIKNIDQEQSQKVRQYFIQGEVDG